MGHESGFLEFRLCRDGRCTAAFHTLPLKRQPIFPVETHDVYFGVAPRTRPAGTADAVEVTRTLWADVDGKAFEGGRAEALRTLQDFGDLTPSIIVDSGNGFHAYWLLAEPLPIAEAQPVMEALRHAINPALDNVADVRRSTDRQEQSIADQEMAVETWAESQGYHILDWYADDAISGASGFCFVGLEPKRKARPRGPGLGSRDDTVLCDQA